MKLYKTQIIFHNIGRLNRGFNRICGLDMLRHWHRHRRNIIAPVELLFNEAKIYFF